MDDWDLRVTWMIEKLVCYIGPGLSCVKEMKGTFNKETRTFPGQFAIQMHIHIKRYINKLINNNNNNKIGKRPAHCSSLHPMPQLRSRGTTHWYLILMTKGKHKEKEKNCKTRPACNIYFFLFLFCYSPSPRGLSTLSSFIMYKQSIKQTCLHQQPGHIGSAGQNLRVKIYSYFIFHISNQIQISSFLFDKNLLDARK